MLYKDFWLISITAEQRAKTCGYWYLIQTHGGTSHTAFRSKGALLRWLGEMNLNPTAYIPDEGVHSTQRVNGSYSVLYVDPAQVARMAGVAVRTLSNGRYVDARITRDHEGKTTLHVAHGPEVWSQEQDLAAHRAEDNYYHGDWNTPDSTRGVAA